jgi:hypothetical protein
METPTSFEQLNIAPEQVLPILLKHLMLLKNENAYLKKLVQLKNAENGLPKNDIGTNNLRSSISEFDNSTNSLRAGMEEFDNGTNNIPNLMEEIENSTKNVPSPIAEMENGTKNIRAGIPENLDSTNSLMGAIAQLDEAQTKGNLLYTLFEKGLQKALDEYLQNTEGTYTLHTYYSDFVEAIHNKNAADEKKQQAQKILSIRDTHLLPAHITVDSIALTKLKTELRKHLVARTKKDMYNNLANELLFLHNTGKATSTELHKLNHISTDGFKKHLANIQRLNFIRKQAPRNYVLTEYAKRILLEVFGVRKDA